MKKPNSHQLGLIFTILGAIAYGVSPAAAHAVYTDGGNGAFVALAITVTRMMALTVVCVLAKRKLFATASHTKGAITGGLLQAMGVTLTFSAFMYLPGPIVVVILFSHTLMLLFLMAWRGEIKITAAVLITTVIALAGLSLVVDLWHQQQVSSLLGYGLAFTSAVIAASRLYVYGSLMKERNPALVGAENFIFASLFLGIFMLFYPMQMPHSLTGFSWLGLTCLTQIIGTFGMFYGIAALGSFQYSLMAKLEPIFTALFSYLLVNEVLKAPQYVGILIVVGSLILYQLHNHQQQKKLQTL